MTPLESAQLLAGGAFLGVLLTLLSQAVLAAIQRRSDFRTKAFDTRLEIYSEYFRTIETWATAFITTKAHIERGDSLLEELKERRSRTNEALEFSKSHADADFAGSPELRAEARRHAEFLDSQTSDLAEQFDLVQKELNKGNEARTILEENRAKVLQMHYRVRLVAGKNVAQIITEILAHVVKGKLPDEKQRETFFLAARSELGIDVSTWWRRLFFWRPQKSVFK